MAILKVTEVFSLIQLPSGNIRPYYAIVKNFDSATGLAELQVSRLNTNNNPQFENVSYLDVPALRVNSYPCGLPHVGPKLGNITGAGTISSNGVSVIGVGTSFTTQLSFNDSIKVNGFVCNVQSIIDDTNLTLNIAPQTAWTNEAYTFSKNDSMNCIYMPDSNMDNWMMGVFLSTDGATGMNSAAFPDGNGGTQIIQFPEMQPAANTGPSMWIPLNIGYTEQPIKDWFNNPANFGPI